MDVFDFVADEYRRSAFVYLTGIVIWCKVGVNGRAGCVFVAFVCVIFSMVNVFIVVRVAYDRDCRAYCSTRCFFSFRGRIFGLDSAVGDQ